MLDVLDHDVRRFLGVPLQPVPLTRALRQRRQRQRHRAALLLSVTQPGTPLFDTAAPSPANGAHWPRFETLDAWTATRAAAGLRLSFTDRTSI